MSDNYLNLLRKMPVFGGLKNDALQLILDHCTVVEKSPGEYFFCEGDRADSFFVLEVGRVIVEKNWNDQQVVLSQLQAGDCIGEMAIIDLQGRSASVKAEQACRAIEVSLLSLHKLFQQDLEQYAIIMMNMGREVSRRMRKADQRLFELKQQFESSNPADNSA